MRTAWNSPRRAAETPVLGHGFSVVAPLAQRLVIQGIPEQFLVATVRADVVGDLGGAHFTLGLAAHAEGVGPEPQERKSAPTATVKPPVRDVQVLVNAGCRRRTLVTLRGSRHGCSLI